MNEILAYGVTERQTSPTEIDLHAENLITRGYTIIKNCFDKKGLTTISQNLDQLLIAEPTEMVSDKNVVRCPLSKNDIFLQIATHPKLKTICEKMFPSSFVLLQQNGIINSPDEPHYQSRWHRDLAYQHFVTSHALAINALLCVDEFNAETGATFILPYSHRYDKFPSDQFVAENELQLQANPGDIILLDAMVFHRAGRNASAKKRRAVNHLIGRPMLAQQIDIPSLLNGRHSEDPFLEKYLGYRWNPARSVESWRKLRV